jgi:aryl-alcohol dehydrogenase-like predicted oxidoreductase
VERRQLGADGPEITVVGIGTAPIGSMPPGSAREWVYWGGQDEREAVAAIQAGLDAGANWIDTAPFYGWGRAEEIVRRALEGRRDDVLLFTKCGTVPDPERVSRMDNRPEAIRADLEASLVRLGVDHVDLLQIHDLDRSTPIEESWGELQRLRAEGKIRWAGLSNHPAELVERAHAVAPVTSCQESLSLLEAPRYPGVLDVVRRHGIGLLCWAPLASGFLVDGFSTETLEPDDFRRSSPLAGRSDEIAAHARDAAARGRTLRRHAIAWVLGQPGVTAAIVGVRNAREGAELPTLAAD